MECDEGELIIEVPQFRAPLLSISLDGEEKGKIAFAHLCAEPGLGRGNTQLTLPPTEIE